MPYSEPTDLAVIACPGSESFANAVITHLKHMYKHRFTLKNDAVYAYSNNKAGSITNGTTLTSTGDGNYGI